MTDQTDLQIRADVALFMGYERYTGDSRKGLFVSPEKKDRVARNIYVGLDDVDTLPAYESDIAAAFEVVERMRELGWWLILDTRSAPEATFKPYSNQPYSGCKPVKEMANEAAMAICKAALAAIRSTK